MPISLTNKVVLTIGASSGIGLAAAELFAREGAKVMASARREDRLLSLQKKLKAEKHAIQIYAADATKPADMERLVAETESSFGRIEIMVFAAGTNTP
jgi:NADP-dependent 3-hydroxy acid dehydrogenase YdfG